MVLVFKVGWYTCILLLSAFGKWTLGLDVGVWREGYERSFTAMDLFIMNANELASAAFNMI
jgi:hypothetical protein